MLLIASAPSGPLDDWALIAANVAGLAVLFGGIALCVRFDQQGRTRRRELEHLERMRAIELDRPLEDAAVARFRALGAIGVAVPVASLSAAAMGSLFVLALKEPVWQFGALAIIWLVAGAVCLAVLPVVTARLRQGDPIPHPGRASSTTAPA